MDMMEARFRMMAMLGVNIMKLVKVGEFTVPESWENDTTGNALSIYDNYISSYFDNDTTTMGIAIAENNNASNYRLKSMMFYCSKPANSNGIVLRESNTGVYTIRNNIRGTSAWCSTGTTITVYTVNQ